MTEVTDEMLERGASVIMRGMLSIRDPELNLPARRAITKAVITAVAPLIEAQARAEIERKDRALERLGYAARTALEGQVELAADLAQARAAAIEEAYILLGVTGDSYATHQKPDLARIVWDLAEEVRALASRPGSEREGADTAPAPAISGGEMVSREIAVGLWDLLDEIDTISDLAKGDDKLYRQLVEKAQRRRFQFGSTDGYSVLFAALAAADRSAS